MDTLTAPPRFEDTMPLDEPAEPRFEDTMPMDEAATPRFEDTLPVDDEAPPRFEDTLPVEDEPQSSRLRRYVADPALALAQGVVDVPKTLIGLGDMAVKLSPAGVIEPIMRKAIKATTGRTLPETSLAKVAETIGADFKTTEAFLDSYLSPEQKADNQAVSEAAGLWNKAKAIITNPSTIVQGVTRSAPTMMGGGAIARTLTAAIPSLSPLVAAAIGEGAMSGGSTAAQASDESAQGTLTTTQAAVSAGSGVATALLGLLGGKLASRFGLDDVDVLLAGQSTGSQRKGILAKVLGGALSEGALEEFPQSWQERIASNLNSGRPAFEGALESALEGAIQGAVMGGGAQIAGAASPTMATAEDVEAGLMEDYGKDRVRRAGKGLWLIETPAGQTLAARVVNRGEELTGGQDPIQTLASMESGSETARKAANAALERAGGDRAAAGRALAAEGWSRQGQALPWIEIEVPQERAEGSDPSAPPPAPKKLEVAGLLEIVAGRATVGTLGHERLHLLAMASGNNAENGMVRDPDTGATIPEERLARALDKGLDHPVVQRIKDFMLRMTAKFRQPGENLWQTANRATATWREQVGKGKGAVRKGLLSPAAAAELEAKSRANAERFDERITQREDPGRGPVVLPGPVRTSTAGALLDPYGRPIPGTHTPMQDGKTQWQARTPQNETTVGGRWRVVEADTLRTSDRPDYDQALQPRNRNTLKSQEQIASIAKDPDPWQLMDSAGTDHGAPLVDSQGQVISGNGRVMGLRQAYAGQTANQYRDTVVDRAQQLGMPEAAMMRQPILVREVTDTGGTTLPVIAEQSNRERILRRTPSEQAEADGRMLRETGMVGAFNPDAVGTIRSPTNREFLAAFVNGSGDSSLVDSKGQFSEEIEPRVRRAMLAAITMEHPQGRQIVQDLIERAEPLGIIRQREGVMSAAPAILTATRGKPDYALEQDLAQALRDLVNFRKGVVDGSWKGIEQYLAQGDLFGDGRTPTSDLLLRTLLDSPKISTMRAFADAYAQAVNSIDTTGQDMFGESQRASKEQVALLALQKAGVQVESGELKRYQVEKKKRGAGTYLNAVINYGGEQRTRGDVIQELQANGVKQPYIDMYMMAAKSVKNDSANQAQDRYQVGKKRIHRTVERLESVQEYQAAMEDAKRDPAAYYEQQLLAKTQQQFMEKAPEDLLNMPDAVQAFRLGEVESANNFGPLAIATAMEKYRAAGDTAKVRELALKLSRSAGVAAQMVRQMASVPGMAPQRMVDAIKDQAEAMGTSLSESTLTTVYNMAEEDIKARTALVEAERKFANQPTEQNAQALQQAEKTADKKNRVLLRKVAEVTPRTWGNIIKTIMQGNVLTPVSIVANTTGNLVNLPMRWSRQAIANLTEQLLLATGMVKTRTVGGVHAWAWAKGFAKGTTAIPSIMASGVAPAALRPGGEVNRGFQPVRALIRALTDQGKPGAAWTYGTLPDTPAPTASERGKMLLEGTLGAPAEVMFRLLSATDTPAYSAAYAQAIEEIGELRGYGAAKLKAWKAAPDAEARALADERATLAVYQGKGGVIANTVMQLANAKPDSLGPEMADMVNALAVRPLALFVRTPMQIAKEANAFLTVPWSATAMTVSIARAQAAKARGDIAGMQRAQREALMHFGEAVTGTMIWSAVYAMVQAGLLAGRGGETDRERDLARLTLKPGHFNASGLRRWLKGQDPSWQPGDVQVDYRTLGIIGLAMNMAATGAEKEQARAVRFGEQYDRATLGFWKLAATTPATLPKAMLELTMLKGATTVLTALDKGTPQEVLAQLFEAVSAVPAPNTLKALSRVVLKDMPETEAQSRYDEDMLKWRSTGREIGNRLATKLHIMRWAAAKATGKPVPLRVEDLPLRLDLLGRTVPMTPAGRNPVVYHLIDTPKAERIQSQALIQEIDRVYRATNMRDAIPSRPSGTLNNPATGRPIKLTEQQLQRWGEIQGTLTQWALHNAITSPSWAQATPYQQAEWLAAMNDRIAKLAKIEMLKELRIIQQY